MRITELKISREGLAEKLINFCISNGLFSEQEMLYTTVETIAWQLDSSWLVEGLIQAIILRASYKQNIDLRELRDVLCLLQELKYELEYGEV